MKTKKEKQTTSIKESENSSVLIKFYYANTNEPEEFVDDLELLCRKYCGNDFFFKYSVEG